MFLSSFPKRGQVLANIVVNVNATGKYPVKKFHLTRRLSFHCRITPARHAAKPYRQERHPDAEEKLKHYIISTTLSL